MKVTDNKREKTVYFLQRFLVSASTHTILVVSVVSGPKVLVAGAFKLLDSQPALANSAEAWNNIGSLIFVRYTASERTLWNRSSHKLTMRSPVTRPALAGSKFCGKVFLALSLGSAVFVRVIGTLNSTLDLAVFSKIRRSVVRGVLAVAKSL